jgi:predicted Zn-dependent peptidase
MVILVKPNDFSDLVAVEVMLKVSICDEAPEQAGIRFLLQQLLVHESFSSEYPLEKWGGGAGSDVGLDYVEFNAVVVSDGFEAALETLAEMLCRPDFDVAAVERVKSETLDYLAAVREQPFWSTYLLFRQRLYGDHPYARAAEGTLETIQSMNRQELLDFYFQWFVPNNTVIAVCGNVTPERAQKAIERAFGGWKGSMIQRPDSPNPPSLTHSLIAVEEGRGAGAHVLIGFPAPEAGEPDEFAAFQVLNSLLGRGMSGRLVEALRNQLGLAYQVSCFHPTLEQQGHLATYVLCEPDQVDVVKDAVVAQINRLLLEKIGDEELESAKAYLLGQYLVSLQRSRLEAHNLAWWEILGLGSNFEEDYVTLVSAISAQDIQKVSQKYLQKMVVTLHLPEERPL